jgi:hypothetical protein
LLEVSGSGLRAPAHFLACAALLAGLAGPAGAQQPNRRPTPAPAQSPVAVPDPLVISKLVWSIMAAVDHANATGNYSVLRDLGAPSFQSVNNAATLAGTFQGIRNQRLDLSNTLLVAPTFDIGPRIENGLLRMRGVFPLRPNPIAFDLLFQSVEGRWALFGVALAPAAAVAPVQGTRR